MNINFLFLKVSEKDEQIANLEKLPGYTEHSECEVRMSVVSLETKLKYTAVGFQDVRYTNDLHDVFNEEFFADEVEEKICIIYLEKIKSTP